MVLSPRESAKFVAELAKDVKIKEEGIKKLGDEVMFCNSIFYLNHNHVVQLYGSKFYCKFKFFMFISNA